MEEQLAAVQEQAVDVQVTLSDLKAAVDKQAKFDRKRLFYQRATFAVLTLILGVFVAAGVYILPMLNEVLAGVNAATAVVSSMDVDAVVDDVDALTAQGLTTMQDISDSIIVLKQFDIDALNGAVVELSAAVENLKDIDIATLNSAIYNLNASVEPLAKFFNVFKKK